MGITDVHQRCVSFFLLLHCTAVIRILFFQGDPAGPSHVRPRPERLQAFTTHAWQPSEEKKTWASPTSTSAVCHFFSFFIALPLSGYFSFKVTQPAPRTFDQGLSACKRSQRMPGNPAKRRKHGHHRRPPALCVIFSPSSLHCRYQDTFLSR